MRYEGAIEDHIQYEFFLLRIGVPPGKSNFCRRPVLSGNCMETGQEIMRV